MSNVKDFLSWYLPKLLITIVMVAAGMGFLALMYEWLDVWGVVGGFAAIIAASIIAYNVSNKKDQQNCSKQKK